MAILAGTIAYYSMLLLLFLLPFFFPSFVPTFLFRLDECKHTASRDRSEFEDRIRQLEHKHSLLESQYQKSALEYNHNLTQKQHELTQVTQTLRQTQAQLHDSNPDVLKQIEYVKDDLSDLFISEAMYLEYKSIDRHRQTIREYVCCSVYELLRTERSAKEAMGVELEMIRAKLIKSEDECDRNAREREQIAKLKRTSVGRGMRWRHQCCE